MKPLPSRLIVVRAWLHDDEVAAVLLVAEPPTSAPVRRITSASTEEACTAFAAVLRELTLKTTGGKTTD